MEVKDANTEETIMKAAEEEFLAKGYSGAKMTEIAKKAGVNHAMLHYYFRSKDNLFNIVFQQKVQDLANCFATTFNHNLSLFDQIRLGVETHFDLMAKDPRLPFFVYNEIIKDEERKKIFASCLYPNINNILMGLEEKMKPEIEKGTIKDINPMDVLLNIVSLNVFPFLAHPFITELAGQKGIDYTDILKHRKENNVQVILNSLKP